MTNLDTVVELQERLRELPTELEDFFQHIIDSTEKIYRQQAARLYLICLAAEEPLNAYDVSWFAEHDADFALADKWLSVDTIDWFSQVHVVKVRVMVRCQDLLEFDRSDELQFLHRTVKDFLEIRDIYAQLEKWARHEFDPHDFICNSMILQLRLIAQGPGLGLNFVNSHRKLQRFWHHSRFMDSRDHLDFSLFPTLDKTVWSLLQSSDHLQLTRFTDFERGHYEGWLADKCAENGLQRFLSRSIGHTVDIIDKTGETLERPPLYVVLRCMTSNHRQDEVWRLLDLGADPNEEYESGLSVWGNYLANIPNRNTLDGVADEIKIIEMLLHQGADPSIGDHEDFFSHQLQLANVGDSDIERLNRLRQSLQPAAFGQQQSQTDRQPKLSNGNCLVMRSSRHHESNKSSTCARWNGPYDRSSSINDRISSINRRTGGPFRGL